MLQIQYRSSFKSRPTLLFAGSTSDIHQLLEVFQHWAGEEIDLLSNLSKSGDLFSEGITGITLSSAKAEKDSYLEWSKERGVWFVSHRGQLRIVGLLEGLRDSAHPGHQYLDIGDPKGIQIMCSKDE